MPVAPLDLPTVKAIFRASEGRTTLYEGRDADPESEAHAIARHSVITGEGLMARLQDETRNGRIGYFAAFLTAAEMLFAALEVLNGAAGTFAREQLLDTAAAPGRPAGSHTGMRTVIEDVVALPVRVRYASGGGATTMPTRGMRMILDRVDERPEKLHIHTFFPTLGAATRVQVKRRDGTQFRPPWP